MGKTATAQCILLGEVGSGGRALFSRRPPSLPGIWAQSTVFCCWRRKVCVIRRATRRVKTQTSGMDYLQTHDNGQPGELSRGRWMGLYPRTAKTLQASWSTLTRTCFTASDVAAANVRMIRFAELYSLGGFPAGPVFAAPVAWLQLLCCTKSLVSIGECSCIAPC